MTASDPTEPANHRILIIDDNPSIHDDFRKVLGGGQREKLKALEDDEAALFGETPTPSSGKSFELVSAFQGQEGLEMVRAAAQAGNPFAMAFVDVRMPPGWDGIETISRIWKEFPELQFVICTAYSDYSWDDIARTLGESDSVLILKKPFDSVEVLQMAHALTKKWQLGKSAQRQMDELDRAVNARTAELRAANEKLQSEMAERSAAESALRHSEDQLRQAQKMEVVGRLAAGIAHDFNNILTVIMGNTSMQLANPGISENASKSLGQVLKASERASDLTRQLLAYSRKQIIQRRAIDLNEQITQTAAMLRRVIGEDIAFVTELASDLSPIFADPTNLDQVFMNLLLNARDAMPEGGRLVVSTSAVEFTEAETAHRHDACAGKFVRLTVRDTGHGMDAATLDSIFEPFFTTKEQGRGTGMGLATTFGIVNQHGGWIEVCSEVGVGTTFEVHFPVHTSAVIASAPPAEDGPASDQPGDGTILVVDDEEMLRIFVAEVLESFGYRVLIAANGAEALQIWEREKRGINLLITDIVMPESISGRQLARQCMRDNHSLKVIYTSGYSSELTGTELESEADATFLAKPYQSSHLARLVSRCLASRAA